MVEPGFMEEMGFDRNYKEWLIIQQTSKTRCREEVLGGGKNNANVGHTHTHSGTIGVEKD